MKEKKAKKPFNIVASFTKIGVYLLFVSALITCFHFAPKEILNNDQIYTLTASLADIDESCVLLDYDVFGSKKRYEEALQNKPLEVLETVKNDGEVLLVRVYGEEYKKTFANDYWFIEDPEAMELNIEYYIVKNVTFMNSSFPCYTFLGLANNLLGKINVVYLILIILISLGICIPFVISISRNTYDIVIYFKKKKQIA